MDMSTEMELSLNRVDGFSGLILARMETLSESGIL
jgi:hypothetical protein